LVGAVIPDRLLIAILGQRFRALAAAGWPGLGIEKFQNYSRWPDAARSAWHCERAN